MVGDVDGPRGREGESALEVGEVGGGEIVTGNTGAAFSDTLESVRRRRPGKAKMERKAVIDDDRLVCPFFIVPGLLPTIVAPSSDSRIVSFEECFP